MIISYRRIIFIKLINNHLFDINYILIRNASYNNYFKDYIEYILLLESLLITCNNNNNNRVISNDDNDFFENNSLDINNIIKNNIFTNINTLKSINPPMNPIILIPANSNK